MEVYIAKDFGINWNHYTWFQWIDKETIKIVKTDRWHRYDEDCMVPDAIEEAVKFELQHEHKLTELSTGEVYYVKCLK